MRLTKRLNEPWFTLIALGLKKVEGRLYKGDFSTVSPDDTIVWTNDDMGFQRELRTRVESVQRYPTFRTFLQRETLNATLPTFGMTSLGRGVNLYRKYVFSTAKRTSAITECWPSDWVCCDERLNDFRKHAAVVPVSLPERYQSFQLLLHAVSEFRVFRR